MDLKHITFPLYKIRSHLSIEENALGKVKIKTIKNEYILDDKSINATFPVRRTKLKIIYPKEEIYPLSEQVLYLRQLVKYRSGTIFIDYNGTILKYKKGKKLFNVESRKILSKREEDNWTIIQVENVEIPFLIGNVLPNNVTHASIMITSSGPFLYDLTNQYHEPYKRKL